MVNEYIIAMDEFHLEELHKHCRDCGNKVHVARFHVNYACEKFCEDLTQAFGVIVDTDDPAIHPHQLCHGCYNVMMCARKARGTGRLYIPCVTPFNWHSHVGGGDGDICSVCKHFKAIAFWLTA